MKQKLVLLMLLCLVLAGCNIPGENQQVTQAPMMVTATALPTLVEPTLAPATPTAASVPLPDAPITLQYPASTSRITSPVVVAGEAAPTFEQSLAAQVYDENGVLIAEGYGMIEAEIGQRGTFEINVPFIVDRQQAGRISVYSVSARDGGLIYLTSSDVTLVPADGPNDIIVQDPQPAFFQISQPAPNSEIGGGVLHVEGSTMGGVFENQIMIMLCGEGGGGESNRMCGTQENVLASAPTRVNAPDLGSGSFSADLPFSVSVDTYARLVVYFASPRDGGIVELNSVEVILKP